MKVILGGKEQELLFNQMAVEVFSKNLDYEAFQTSAAYAMFFAGLKGAYYANRKEVDFSFADVIKWVDELHISDKETIKKVDAEFAQTAQYREWLKEFKDRVRLAVEAIEGEEKPKKKTARK